MNSKEEIKTQQIAIHEIKYGPILRFYENCMLRLKSRVCILIFSKYIIIC